MSQPPQGLEEDARRIIKHLLSRSGEDFYTSGQWMTERGGGSDVAQGTETIARRLPDGTYALYGYKWFTSATEADIALTLARIGDMYEVCGQAQRSVLWLHNKDRRTDLFAHLLKREALRTESGRPSRLELGNRERLIQLKDLSRACRISIRVFIVQPGLSKEQAADHQLAVLGVTEKFLQETYQVPLQVYCS